MNTFTNNGQFVRPQGYRECEDIIKDLKMLIKESDIHGQVLYIEQLLETAGRGNKRNQKYAIQDAIACLIMNGYWENKNGLPHESDAVFMATYLPHELAAMTLGVTLRRYKAEFLF